MKTNLVILIMLLIVIGTSCNKAPVTSFQVIAGLNDTTLLLEPFGMCTDDEGNVFIADIKKHCISRVNTKGQVAVFAGTGEQGALDGNKDQAMFNSPSGVCFDTVGNMYVAGFGGQNVRKITPEGKVSTIAGTGEEGYRDGKADSAKFSSPRGVCIDSEGNVFVADCWNHRIRKISPDGVVSTFAGGGTRGELVENAWKDGPDTTARFDAPCGLSIDCFDNIYVADANNNSIRKISPDGMVTTLAGIERKKGLADGPLEVAELNVPTEVFVYSDGTVYFSDTYNHCIRKITSNGIIETIAGTGEKGFTEAPPLKALLSSPRGICVYNNELYFVEWGNHVLRKIKL